MAQFYFLSVLFNILVGLVLTYGKDLTEKEDANLILSENSEDKAEDKMENEEIFEGEENLSSEIQEKNSSEKKSLQKKHSNIFKNSDFLNSSTFRLICGVLSAFVGIMKLLSVFRNDVPVVGDLLPSLAGIAGGASLLIEYYAVHATSGEEIPEMLNKIFIGSRKYIGIICLAAGLLHFVFPQVVLL